MDLEHELRALDPARFTTDETHFDTIKEQAWMNHVSQKRVHELEVEPFETGALRTGEETIVTAISSFVPLNLETRLGSIPAVPQKMQSSRKNVRLIGPTG